MDIRDGRQIHVMSSYDVVVVGGGIAGISAAVAAAREGSRTLTIEKGIVFGGLSTVGLINWYEPLCDGRGTKMVGGIAEELIRLSVKYGFQDLPKKWGGKDSSREDGRYSTHFSPTLFAMALDEFLRSNNVDILLDCLMTFPVMENERCTGIAAEAKEGRLFFPAKAVIDATGDASVFAAAGAATVCGQNYLSYYGHVYDKETIDAYEKTGSMVRMRKWVIAGVNPFAPGEAGDKRSVSGVTAREITDFVLEGRRMFFEKIKDGDPEGRDVSMIPFMPQFRTIRRISGAGDFTATDGLKYADAVGSCGDFRKDHLGKHYQIPFSAQYSREIPNLIAAGRIISATEEGWEVSRVIPVCALTGQAAGIAASMTLGRNVQNVDIKGLQGRLADSGVVFM
ncbi:MAG: FAD-dependent oxidoreductase [Spirochaetales bacterium]|nr:FAD-dependent oxidoreductase [Spirochaetales bacterium]